mmetsp:Transcript_32291/g.49444  ORF Transcript_32291/g.49444 Transcript_32291/m.49444 type:complete len:88 (+) Transcript_32291:37-300(+)
MSHEPALRDTLIAEDNRGALSKCEEESAPEQKPILQSILTNAPYISEQQGQNLQSYKYQGGDEGLTYIYFYNPLSKWLVTHLPMWLA